MQRVQIKTSRCECNGTRCIIGEREMRFVKSMDLHVSPDEVPTFKFETVGIPDIDVIGDVTIDPSPTNLQEACRIITHELLKHGEFYSAFVGSVASILEQKQRYVGDGCFCIDIDGDTDYKGLAEEIVKRISGEE